MKMAKPKNYVFNRCSASRGNSNQSYTQTRRRSTSMSTDRLSANWGRRSLNARPVTAESCRAQKEDKLLQSRKPGFTIHFSLARALKTVRKQEKEIYRPTLKLQRINHAPVLSRHQERRKRKPILKRFVFDHISKEWKQELIFEDKSRSTAQLVSTRTDLPLIQKINTPKEKMLPENSSKEAGQAENLIEATDTTGYDNNLVYYVEPMLPSSTSASDLASLDAGTSECGTATPRSEISDAAAKDQLDSILKSLSRATIDDVNSQDSSDDEPEIQLGRRQRLNRRFSRLSRQSSVESNYQCQVGDILAESDMMLKRSSRRNSSSSSIVKLTNDTTETNQNNLNRIREDTFTPRKTAASQRRNSMKNNTSNNLNEDKTSPSVKREPSFLTTQMSTGSRRKMISDSDGTEDEMSGYPGCRYLYRLVHCRGTTNPHALRDREYQRGQPRSERLNAAGVIEVYTGHTDVGSLPANLTCPYCIVEPGKRIGRWLSGLDSPEPTPVYTSRDANCYMKRDRKLKRRETMTESKLMAISEV